MVLSMSKLVVERGDSQRYQLIQSKGSYDKMFHAVKSQNIEMYNGVGHFHTHQQLKLQFIKQLDGIQRVDAT